MSFIIRPSKGCGAEAARSYTFCRIRSRYTDRSYPTPISEGIPVRTRLFWYRYMKTQSTKSRMLKSEILSIRLDAKVHKKLVFILFYTVPVVDRLALYLYTSTVHALAYSSFGFIYCTGTYRQSV